jgi:hypothetical protein
MLLHCCENLHLSLIIFQSFNGELLLLRHLVWLQCLCDRLRYPDQLDCLLGYCRRWLCRIRDDIYMFYCYTGCRYSTCTLLMCFAFQKTLSLVIRAMLINNLRHSLRRSLWRLQSWTDFLVRSFDLTCHIYHWLALNHGFLGEKLWASLRLNIFCCLFAVRCLLIFYALYGSLKFLKSRDVFSNTALSRKKSVYKIDAVGCWLFVLSHWRFKYGTRHLIQSLVNASRATSSRGFYF